ncbi:hypothetical protein V1511DRAFT_494141, partial [Dipodascopsis uninucleata]
MLDMCTARRMTNYISWGVGSTHVCVMIYVASQVHLDGASLSVSLPFFIPFFYCRSLYLNGRL